MWNYIYQNRFEASGYRASAKLYNSLQPDLILPGHAEPIWVQPEYLQALCELGEALERFHHELLVEQVSGFQMEGFGARILPYHTTPAPGEIIEYLVEIYNPFPNRENCVVQMVVPPTWEVIEGEFRVWLDAGASRVVQFHVKPQYNQKVRRARLAVNLTIGSQQYGQQAEALVTIR